MNINPFRSNKIYIVIIKEYLDGEEIRERRQRRSFLSRRNAAEFAQNNCYYSSRKQIIARIYAL